jgi:hypothetical protein
MMLLQVFVTQDGQMLNDIRVPVDQHMKVFAGKFIT